MKTRDPEQIRKDIEIADLKASNCALQGGMLMEQMNSRRLAVDECKRNQAMHDAEKATFEAELKEAVAERANGQPSKPLVPLELIVNGQARDASPSSSEPPATPAT
jgi:hypothetical protein